LRYAQVAPAEADVSDAGSLAFEARGCRSGESRTEGTRRGGRCGVPGGHRDPPWPLARHRAGLRGPSVGRANRGCPRSRASGSCLPALPWVSRARRGPTTALRHRSNTLTILQESPGPSVDLPPRVNSRRDRSLGRASAPSACQGSSGRVPSSWFCTTSTVCSAHHTGASPMRVRLRAGQGRRCIATCYRLGFAAFRRWETRPTDIAARRRDHTTASSRRVHTPRRFPRQQPDGVTTAVAPVTFHRSCGPRRTRTALARR
jgi:hypothetical protein